MVRSLFLFLFVCIEAQLFVVPVLIGNRKFNFGFGSLSAATSKQIWGCKNYSKFVSFGASTTKATFQKGVGSKQEA